MSGRGKGYKRVINESSSEEEDSGQAVKESVVQPVVKREKTNECRMSEEEQQRMEIARVATGFEPAVGGSHAEADCNQCLITKVTRVDDPVASLDLTGGDIDSNADAGAADRRQPALVDEKDKEIESLKNMVADLRWLNQKHVERASSLEQRLNVVENENNDLKHENRELTRRNKDLNHERAGDQMKLSAVREFIHKINQVDSYGGHAK